MAATAYNGPKGRGKMLSKLPKVGETELKPKPLANL